MVAPAASIFANNTPGGDCAGAGLFNSLGYNIDTDGSCGLTAEGDRPGTDPELGPLGDHGGPTPTHPLLASSPAIDQVPFQFCDEGADQRGVSLPQGERCDIGASEAGDPCTHMLSAVLTPEGTLNLHFNGIGRSP